MLDNDDTGDNDPGLRGFEYDQYVFFCPCDDDRLEGAADDGPGVGASSFDDDRLEADAPPVADARLMGVAAPRS